jgi:aspartyl-tRNA(Asn)/glutamyl-tRNA(Gln) amidotransferase subunit B
VRDSLVEFPSALRRRLESSYGISGYDSDVLVNQGRALVDFYIEVAERSGDGKLASNWVQQDVLRRLNAGATSIHALPVKPHDLAELLIRIKAGQLETSRARDVFEMMMATSKTVDEAVASLGIQQVTEHELMGLCRELLAANPHILADIRAGKTKAAGALVGQAKKKNPNVNPAQVRDLCIELAEKMPSGGTA